MESSVHDKDSFTKEQTKFSGSKSLLNTPKPAQSHTKSDTVKPNDPLPSTSEENPTINKRITVAELFMKESEKAMENNKPAVAVTETIEKFDRMDLYKSIFLSDSEDEDETPSTKLNDNSAEDFIDKPKNVERNLSPPRGIFANIDFDELNSWRRNAKTDKEEKADNKNNSKEETAKETQNNKEDTADVYGPKIPENLMKRLESNEEKRADDTFRPIFRKKTEKEVEIHEINSSSSEDSWVEAKEVKSKKVKKKKKKHKVKHKKSKHKKKDR